MLHFTATTPATLGICCSGGVASGPSVTGSTAVQGQASQQLLPWMGPSLAASVILTGSFCCNGTANPVTRPELHLLGKWLVRTLDLLILHSLKALPSPYWRHLQVLNGQTCQPHCVFGGKEKQAPGAPHEDFLLACLPVYTGCRQALNCQVKPLKNGVADEREKP